MPRHLRPGCCAQHPCMCLAAGPRAWEQSLSRGSQRPCSRARNPSAHADPNPTRHASSMPCTHYGRGLPWVHDTTTTLPRYVRRAAALPPHGSPVQHRDGVPPPPPRRPRFLPSTTLCVRSLQLPPAPATHLLDSRSPGLGRLLGDAALLSVCGGRAGSGSPQRCPNPRQASLQDNPCPDHHYPNHTVTVGRCWPQCVVVGSCSSICCTHCHAGTKFPTIPNNPVATTNPVTATLSLGLSWPSRACVGPQIAP